MDYNRSIPLAIAALVVVAMVGVLAIGPSAVLAQTPDDSSKTISVSATGEASASPDKAVVQLAVTASGEDPATVRDQLSATAADLRSTLDELGVDYQTSRYSLSETNPRDNQPDRPAYEGVHGFTVTLDDPDATGDVVDAAADAGASVRSVQLTLAEDTRESLRDEAIQNAMDDARHQATTIAAAGDLSVTGAHTIQASQQYYRPVTMDGGAAMEAGASTGIDSGPVSVSYNVQVTYNATGA